MTSVRAAVFLLALALALPCAAPASGRFAVVASPAPVFNVADFPRLFGGSDGRTPPGDSCGQVRQLEFVALTGTAVTVEEEVRTAGGRRVARITTADYPSDGKPLYVDAALLEMKAKKPPERPRSLPAREEILRRLEAAAGTTYVWGGNVRGGIPELLELYPPKGSLTPQAEKRWTLAGVDCSGLLYEATEGFTPRNTSELVSFGRALPVSGKKAEQIAAMLKPLDLIVWRGHVIVVLDRERTIESRLSCGAPGNGGVVIRPLVARLREAMKTRLPVDDDRDPVPTGKQKFVVRRWLE